MRQCYIVSYDISNDKRLRNVYKLLRGYGDHVQLSMFRCELNNVEKIKMIGVLNEQINHRDDQILIIDLGPVPGRGEKSIESLGQAYTCPERHCRVL